MAKKTKKTKSSEAFPEAMAYVIGDMKYGFTIVLTNPVLVAHYSIADLTGKNDKKFGGTLNAMKNKPIERIMAALVSELVPYMRGANLDVLEQYYRDIHASPHGEYSLDDEKTVFREVHNAWTVAGKLEEGSTISDVDFCLAFPIKSPKKGEIMARSLGPVSGIIDYINNAVNHPKTNPPSYAPKKFGISNIDNIENALALPAKKSSSETWSAPKRKRAKKQ